MKKSQGEIFGLALFFVIIIVAILFYIQFQALDPNRDADAQQEGEYKILAESSLNTILDLSTGCYVERGRDSIQDLINYCLEFSFTGEDPEFTCDFSPTPIRSCEYAVEKINETLFDLYNTTELGPIPFEFLVEVPLNQDSLMNNITLTNFGSFEFKETKITDDNYRSYQFKRAPSGLKTWATAQRNINMELYLYYR